MSDEKLKEDVNAKDSENEEDKKQSKEDEIKSLTQQLEEELVLTSSLTHMVAERTSEVEYLKGKITDQDAKIRNLEDQIEEWTNQSESCDKLLEQKDCELEMLKKTWNIEKQQRRDLEEMMMEGGRDSLKEKGELEGKIKDLEVQVKQLQQQLRMYTDNEELGNGPKWTDTAVITETSTDDANDKEASETNGEIRNEDKEVTNEEIQEDSILSGKLESLENKHRQEIEELMADLFKVVKQNEDLKDEMETLKNEQANMIESKREVINDLEKNLDEKSAENERQRHEIRRMSSTIELSGMTMNPERDEMLNTLREEYEGKIEDCEFVSAELKSRLLANDTEREALVREIANLSMKLDMEREQNAELNKQILEVSNLYDKYYTKCEEMEKLIQAEEMEAGSAKEEGDRRSEEGDSLSSQLADGEASELVDGEMGKNALDSKNLPRSISSNYDHSTDTFRCELDSSTITAKDKEIKSDEKTTDLLPKENKTTKISEEILNESLSLFKHLSLIFLTFLSILTSHKVFGIHFKYATSALIATWLFVYNYLRFTRKPTKELTMTDQHSHHTSKLRRALQDAIMRLDDENFKQFSAIYEDFITATYKKSDCPAYGIQEHVHFLNSSKITLEKELRSLRIRNQETSRDFLAMKREIDEMKEKRLDEDDAKDKRVIDLKKEVASLERRLQDKYAKITDDSQDDETTPPSKSKYMKYLLMSCCVCICAVYIDDYTVLPVITMLHVFFTIMLHQLEKSLEIAKCNVLGFKKTIRNLLNNIEESKNEEKQISHELKEMETVIEKDYEIITKQRNAIERLERQLQRAIRKYQDKKRLTSRLSWLHCHGFGPKEAKDTTDNDIFLSDAANPSIKVSTDSIFSMSLIIIMLCLAGLIAWYSGILVDLDTIKRLIDNGFLMISTSIVIMFAVVAISKLYNGRKNRADKTGDAALDIASNDEEMLNDHVDTLRGLLQTERGVVRKLEREIETSKTASMHLIPNSEINSVIDKLIELAKQKDELQLTAENTKDKYDNVKRTLEDILSREKYLSEEVKNLRSQKRELQNDLMKEQVKCIDMFEELKKMQGIDGLDVEAEANVSGSESSSEDVFAEAINDQGRHSIDKGNRKKKHKKANSRNHKDEDSLFDADIDCIDAEEELRTSTYESLPTYLTDDKGEGHNKTAKAKVRGEENLLEGQRSQNGSKVRDDGQKIELLRLQDQLMKEKLKNFELSERIANFEIDGSIKAQGKDSDEVDNVEQQHNLQTSNLLSENENSAESEKAKLKRNEALLQAKEIQLEELRQIINIVNESRIYQRDVNTNRNGVESVRDDDGIVFDVQPEKKEEFFQDLRKLGKDIRCLKNICEDDMKIMSAEEDETEPHILVNNLIEQIGVFRYLIQSEKAAVTAKLNGMEEKTEELQTQIVNLNNEIEKEKCAKNDIIREYEDEYERLEQRLTEAYENIRKRLTEERVLRGQIMKQYEGEIEEIQAKTGDILKDLQRQLKQERREKEDAEHQSQVIMKKMKSLELDLQLIEAKSLAEIDIDKILSNRTWEGENEGKDRNRNNKSGLKQPDLEEFRKVIEEETTKRTKMLRGKLDDMAKEILDYQSRLNEREAVIDRLEKQESGYKRKIDVQEQRLKDLEHELRTIGAMEMEAFALEDKIYFGRDGVIGSLSAKKEGGTWENPAITGIVQVTRSSAGFGNASDILDIQPLPCSTEDLEDSWFSVDLGEVSVIPESYALRHGWLSSDACLRSWLFEGSIDGSQWHTIQKHTMDTSFTERYSSAKWKVPETLRPFRHFRIRMTGRNSSNTNELYISGFEVFGKVVHS